jgi:release factor glutamine methyltransferase
LSISPDFPCYGETQQKLCRSDNSQFFRKPNIRLDSAQGMKGLIGKILSEATAALQTAEITEPRKEAASLLMHTLNVDRAFVIAHPERELSPDEILRFREVVARRATREPLQYITGVQEFFNLKFAVTPDVLIPRPETELVVEAALDLLGSTNAPLIADVGTGSGCIAISLLHEMPSARAIGIDISASALAVANRNAERHAVSRRFAVAQVDGLSAFPPEPIFSAIVSNPPYIPAGEIDTLQPEVRDYEPSAALVAGADGLSHIRILVRDAARSLRTGGYLTFEIGFDQKDAVKALVDLTIWDLVEIKNDMQKLPRVFVLRKI